MQNYENSKPNFVRCIKNLILVVQSDLFTIQCDFQSVSALSETVTACLLQNFTHLVSLIAQIPQNCSNTQQSLTELCIDKTNL